MKIKVHEIEGDYYCAIDDITVAISRASGRPTPKEKCFISIIQDYRVYLKHKEKDFFAYKVSHDACKPVPSGLYLIYDYDFKARKLYLSNLKPTIEDVYVYTLEGNRSLFDLQPNGEDRPIPVHAGFCFIELLDAKIYLSPHQEIEFIMPKTQKTKPAEQARAKTTNKQEEVLTALALAWHGADKVTRLEPKELAKQVISDLNEIHDKLGIKSDIIKLETLEKYLTNGIERITE